MATDHQPWDPLALPDQTGRTVVVTGGNAGIGYFVAEQLAGAGARVVLACRDQGRAAAARTSITRQHPGADVRTMALDLASSASIRGAAERIGELDRVDALVLNAAVMSVSTVGAATEDGLDPVMGTGHLGNVALLAQALPALARTPGSRIVGTTSGLVRRLRPRIGDVVAASRPLRSVGVIAVGRRYTLSKAVHEAFFAELDRRLRAVGSPVSALLSHPGMAVDSRTPARAGVLDDPGARRRLEPFGGRVGAGKDTAAWSAVRAAADPHARGGQHYRPAGAVTGLPVLGRPDPWYSRPTLGARVWAQTEAVLGFRVDVGAPAPRPEPPSGPLSSSRGGPARPLR